MGTESETTGVEAISAKESVELERLWAAGRLRHHHDMVLAFAREQCSAILELAAGQRDPAALSGATSRLIATLRTVHHPSEMQAQMREMHNEIWYCGERGDHDHQRIKRDWVACHGQTWRQWRIKEYLFVAGCCAREIAEIVNVL
jgi:hypothetical protein